MAKRSNYHCSKRRFHDPEQAKDALFHARVVRKYELDSGKDSTRGETRWYFCANCRGFHLTSQSLRIDVSIAQMISA